MVRSAAEIFLVITASLCAASVSPVEKVQVIGAGQGRTGTESLRLALNALNFGPTYHMGQLQGIGASRPVSPLEMLGLVDGHCDHWAAVEANTSLDRPVDWGFLVDDYKATLDLPAAAYFRELLLAYPQAKVILTVRDKAAVHRSSAATWCRLIGVGSRADWLDWLVSVAYSLGPYGRRFFRMHDAMGRATGRALGKTDFSFRRVCEDTAYGMEFFDEWNAMVRRVVPASQLLVFETGKHGYEELAGFLGVEVPAEPYPSTNSAAEFAFVINIMRVFAVLSVTLPGLLAWCVFKRRKGAHKRKTN